MKRIQMSLGKNTYPIFLGEKIIHELPNHLNEWRNRRIFLLSDERLTQARAKILKILKQQKFNCLEIPLKAGESLKEIEAVYPLYGQLLEGRADRHSLILALGGGSVGDVAGFVAGTFMRGIDWVGIPTTLLAQVDSSVGGKTGINHRVGKNLIGVFHQPKKVLVDPLFLKTLSKREMVSGLGEAIKYALTFDKKLFHFFELEYASLLKRKPEVLESVIHQALKWKVKMVSQDELDRKGIREALNFGHTFGHALEKLTRFSHFQHGEAVIWGMRFALALSVVRKKLVLTEAKKMDALLDRFPVPALPQALDPKQVFEAMKKDKKSNEGKVRFILLDRIGHSVLDSRVSEDDLQRAYEILMSGKVGEKDKKNG